MHLPSSFFALLLLVAPTLLAAPLPMDDYDDFDVGRGTPGLGYVPPKIGTAVTPPTLAAPPEAEQQPEDPPYHPPPPEGADDVAPKSGVGPSETGGISVPEDQMGAHGGGGRGGH